MYVCMSNGIYCTVTKQKPNIVSSADVIDLILVPRFRLFLDGQYILQRNSFAYKGTNHVLI